MTTIHGRGRIALAGILAAAALGSAAPAQAGAADKAERCEARLEQRGERRQLVVAADQRGPPLGQQRSEGAAHNVSRR